MPVQNGITEHTHYSIFNAVQLIMIVMRLLKSLWTEFVKAVYYICNQLSKKKEPSTYEMIKKHKSDLTHLYILECKMFIMLPEEWRSLKLDAKFWQRIYVEYKNSNQYCIYNSVTKCISIYQDIIFCENQHYDCAILPDQWEPSNDLPDEIPETSNQENNEDWVPLSLPFPQI